jgi:hypothetical protein
MWGMSDQLYRFFQPGDDVLFALDDDVRWPEVVIHVYAHLVGREIADVSHGGFDGVVFAEEVVERSRFWPDSPR